MPTAISTIRGVFHAMGFSLFGRQRMMSRIPRRCQGRRDGTCAVGPSCQDSRLCRARGLFNTHCRISPKPWTDVIGLQRSRGLLRMS